MQYPANLGRLKLKLSCAAGSFLACLVPGCALRHLERDNNRVVVDNGMAFPNHSIWAVWKGGAVNTSPCAAGSCH